jgi:cbb3-type cytochrome oxidase maturation protein
MSVMYILVPVTLVVIGCAVAAYVWAARKGQFDDLSTPALRILHDDEPPPGPDRPVSSDQS